MLRPETNGACHWLIGTKRAGDGHKAISRLAARPTIYRYKSLWGWRDWVLGKGGKSLSPESSFPNSYSSSLTLSPVPAKRRSSDQRASTPRMSLEETGRGMMPLSKRLHSCWRLLRSTACTCRPWSGRAKAEYRARARSPRDLGPMPAAESGSRATGLRP